MSYQLEALNKNSLLVRTGEVITEAEFSEINEQILLYSRKTNGAFNLITDMLVTVEHPEDTLAFSKMLEWASEPSMGWVIYLTKNPALSTNIATTMNTYDQTYMVLDSLKSALSIIAMPAA